MLKAKRAPRGEPKGAGGEADLAADARCTEVGELSESRDL